VIKEVSKASQSRVNAGTTGHINCEKTSLITLVQTASTKSWGGQYRDYPSIDWVCEEPAIVNASTISRGGQYRDYCIMDNLPEERATWRVIAKWNASYGAPLQKDAHA